MTTLPDHGWTDPLRAVQRRERTRLRLRLLRTGLSVFTGGALLLGLLRWGFVPGLPWPGALAAAALVALGGVSALAWQARPFLELDAARLADRRAALDGVLTTALTLPEGGQDALALALHTRVRQRATEAARTVQAARVVPAEPARLWVLPLALLLLALGAWNLPARPSRSAPSVAAVVPDQTTTSEAAPAQTANPAPDTPQADPQTKDDGNFLNDIPQGQEPEGTDAPTSDARTGQAASAAEVNVNLGAFTPKQVREARQAILPTDTAAVERRAARIGGQAVDTPFGSREGGRISDKASGANPDALAAAPYDPTTANGASLKQKPADPGSSGLRQASGGRGVESDGSERCVDQCLTNNDMNRGGDRSRDGKKPPGEGVSAGTSDSGAQAAGSSSGTGLGVGALKELEIKYRENLIGSSDASADRVQVLVAPSAAPPTVRGSAATGTAWRPALEAPAPDGTIPEQARNTVKAYFDRSTP